MEKQVTCEEKMRGLKTVQQYKPTIISKVHNVRKSYTLKLSPPAGSSNFLSKSLMLVLNLGMKLFKFEKWKADVISFLFLNQTGPEMK